MGEKAPTTDEATSEYVKTGPMPVEQQTGKRHVGKEFYDPPPLSAAIFTYMTYAVLTLVGYVRDFLRFLGVVNNKACQEAVGSMEDMFKLNMQFENFFTRNMYTLIRDCFERPLASCPGAEVEVMHRYSDDGNWTYNIPGTTKKCLNMGSYNYLGFAETSGPCVDAAKAAIRQFGGGCCSTRSQFGNTGIVRELERNIARFVGKEDAVVFGMGFATNSTNMKCLVSKSCLILSDKFNHTSLIIGARLTGATIRVFKHNSTDDLEKKLREAIIYGQPRTHKPWKKILIVVEGVYSMEGSVAKLPEIIALKKKYKAYLYLDEAHSIGAMGPTGRGVVEYNGCDPADVDIMMGTFTKSFGGNGGYIAASKEVISYIRQHSHSIAYATAMTPVIASYVNTSLKLIMGEGGTNEGQKRITALAENSRYFRQKLVEKGFIVYGNEDSPVVPILVYFPGKLCYLSRQLLKDGIAVVIVGFPATDLIRARVRICLSASHTKEMLDKALEAFDDLGDYLNIKYKQKSCLGVTY